MFFVFTTWYWIYGDLGKNPSPRWNIMLLLFHLFFTRKLNLKASPILTQLLSSETEGCHRQEIYLHKCLLLLKGPCDIIGKVLLTTRRTHPWKHCGWNGKWLFSGVINIILLRGVSILRVSLLLKIILILILVVITRYLRQILIIKIIVNWRRNRGWLSCSSCSLKSKSH